MTPGPFNPFGVLFRKARATAERARRIASGQLPVSANPKQREADETVVTIVLAHAAVESAWNWEQGRQNITGNRWPKDFEKALAQVAADRDRPPPVGLDPGVDQRLQRLNAWRNFLQHGDERSRNNLQSFGDDPDDPSKLTAALATEAAEVTEAVLKYIAGATGGQDLTGPALWVDPSEVGGWF